MALVFGSIQLLRFVDMTSPRTIMLLRMGYIGSQMLMLLFWLYIRGLAKKNVKKDEGMVEIEETAAPFSGGESKKVKMTVSEYDVLEARKQLQQIVIGSVIMMALHFYFGMVQPLFLQILLPWKSLITQPLVQIYLFGYQATGPLKRPFKTPSPFAELMTEATAEPKEEEEEAAEVPVIKSGEAKEGPRKNNKKAGRKED